MTPKVSVIVIAYNVESYVSACLDSLVAQTLDDLEVIVVNDGSTDGTQAIIDDFIARHPDTIRSFEKPNSGPADARNLGLELARGEFIGFVDGDDTVKPDMYEELLAKAEDTAADVVVCGYVTVDEETGERSYKRQGWAKNYGKSLSEQPRMLRWVAAYVWNKLFRRSLFDETGIRFPSGKLFEDIPVMYSLLAKANRVEKVQRALYNYTRNRKGAITHSYSPKNLQMFESLAILNDFYDENGLFDEFREELLLLNFRHAFNRFTELPLYSGFGIKQRLVDEAWRHLDEQFPGWRDEALLRDVHRGSWRFGFFVNPIAARLYAAAPRGIHVATDVSHHVAGRIGDFVERFGVKRRRLLAYARYLRRLPVDPSVALVESFYGKQLVDSPFYLMRDLAARGTHRIYVSAADVQEARRTLERYGIDATPVEPGSREYLRVLATAGLLVNNSSFPTYLVKRPEQVYVNTWHGTPLKTLGKSMPYGLRDLPNLQRNFLKADFVLFTNEPTRERMTRDYMLDICGFAPLVMGSPRNAALFDQERAALVRDELGLTGKRVLLYMPTWRGGNSRQAQSRSFSEEIADYLSVLESSLGDDEVLLVKLHHLVESELDFEGYTHVRPTPREYETYDLLNVADTLITDYSSVLFDFAATGREILLFAYDKAEYLAERNLYLTYDELPFPIFATVEALAARIGARTPFEADGRYREFAERFTGLDGPEAARAVNDAVLGTGAATTEGSGPPVDLVFLPYLGKKGQETLERLLAKGRGGPDTVFVFSIKRNYARANAYLYKRFSTDGLDIRYVVTTGRMLVTARQSIALWLHRRTGLFRRTVDEVYRWERLRLLGDLNVRSVADESGYRKYAELAQALSREIARRAREAGGE